MVSNVSGDYIFVEFRAESKEEPISRGSKISHALRRHHREARRELTRKHLASRRPARNIVANSAALPLRDRLLKHSVRLKPYTQDDAEQDGRAYDLEILQPGALKAILGQGRLDPFNVYPAQNLCLYIHEVLDHGKYLSLSYTRQSLSRVVILLEGAGF